MLVDNKQMEVIDEMRKVQAAQRELALKRLQYQDEAIKELIYKGLQRAVQLGSISAETAEVVDTELQMAMTFELGKILRAGIAEL